jgi:hypothetical protein
MSTKSKLVSITGITLIAASTLSTAATTNPLSPGYQKYGVTISAPDSANAKRYVDAANPLTPTYTRSGEAIVWVPTTLRAEQLYRDTANPLHPGFKRI